MPHIENYDHCLHFQVLDKVISFLDGASAEVVADNHGNICISIEFDEQWDGVGKTARFIYNGKWIDVPLNTDGECICPSEVVKKGRFSLGVYGSELKTTTPIVINVKASILSDCEGELPADPTPGEYTQIMNLYEATCEAADEATQKACEAIEAAEAASKQLVDTKKELEEGGFIEGFLEKNKSDKFSVWIGTQAEYDKLPEIIPGCFYIIEDDNARIEITNDVVSRVRAELIDYPVEQGIRDGWNYEVWKSGKVEFWGKFDCWFSNGSRLIADPPSPFDVSNESIHGSIVMSEAENVPSYREVKCHTVRDANGRQRICCDVLSNGGFTVDTYLQVYISVKGIWK